MEVLILLPCIQYGYSHLYSHLKDCIVNLLTLPVLAERIMISTSTRAAITTKKG
ncbi:hypothetical protein LOZ80_04715 [Paenibacillus sp. HWE-109]|uniref:hypothetical protein n=1 Tax=Paenibacillus sp. HWE-109 TaxID=1306526 RepID=UPI001EDEB165|nr:hypothetical protein [Paenibacillus sp. HWE-109]UKS28243.1 hypothetical protein LOZ80_04715 [Paenibacillus sp. HWE-109]